MVMVWRKAPSSLYHGHGFSCVWDVLVGLLPGLLIDGTESSEVQCLIVEWRLALPP